ncbi:hypothetical protein DFJ74DRAFT_710808 [Hyaloraphidium curvatum]|nr:hypothetical protein DFJ74DRAFT_710808 [Hyaloraphidium curvatum]
MPTTADRVAAASKFSRAGDDLLAAAFAAASVGSAVMMSGGQGGLEYRVPSFAAAANLNTFALATVAAAGGSAFSMPFRAACGAAAALFGATAARMYFAGERILATAAPLPAAAYAFFSISLVGIAATVASK